MNRRSSRLLLLSILSAAATFAAAPAFAADPAPAKPAATDQEDKGLLPGDPAPKLQVAKWVKGDGVKEFEKGKTYVVEFWATWCGPCKVSIPHLTQLAHANKDKVIFSGISVWESGENFAQVVDDFVKDQGAAMDYNVARDDKAGNAGTMAKTWMEAAGRSSIPTAFIINGEGKIAWIGHPMELEKPLADVLAGKIDMNASREAAQTEYAQGAVQREMMKDFKPVNTAMDKKDFPAALVAVDAFIKKHPEMEEQIRVERFTILLKADETKAYAAARELGKGAFKDDGDSLNALAWTILDNKDAKHLDADVAYELSQKAVELTKNENAMFLDTFALATFKKGDPAKAIELETKALSMVKNLGLDANTQTEMTREMQGRLEEFSKSKK